MQDYSTDGPCELACENGGSCRTASQMTCECVESWGFEDQLCTLCNRTDHSPPDPCTDDPQELFADLNGCAGAKPYMNNDCDYDLLQSPLRLV